MHSTLLLLRHIQILMKTINFSISYGNFCMCTKHFVSQLYAQHSSSANTHGSFTPVVAVVVTVWVIYIWKQFWNPLNFSLTSCAEHVVPPSKWWAKTYFFSLSTRQGFAVLVQQDDAHKKLPKKAMPATHFCSDILVNNTQQRSEALSMSTTLAIAPEISEPLSLTVFSKKKCCHCYM